MAARNPPPAASSTAPLDAREAQKRDAGRSAAALARDGMVVGLGTGSTVRHTSEALGERMQREGKGFRIQGIPTSEASARLAAQLGIPLTDLDAHPAVDLTIDGADEFDPQFRLIKGGGGALTREKIVAHASRRMVVVADAAKRVEKLGSTFPLPIEVISLGKTPLLRHLENSGAVAGIRRNVDGTPFRTDNGNPIVDAKWPHIANPEKLEMELEAYPGVVCSGLFIGLCQEVHLAGPGGVQVLRKA